MNQQAPPDLPDVVGWPAEDAVARLKELGYRVRTAETAPPRPGGKPRGGRRVLRQRLLEGEEVSLLLAWEGYGG